VPGIHGSREELLPHVEGDDIHRASTTARFLSSPPPQLAESRPACGSPQILDPSSPPGDTHPGFVDGLPCLVKEGLRHYARRP